MSKSIKLKNGYYWDSKSIRNGIDKITFSIPANSSKKIVFSDTLIVILFVGKSYRGAANDCRLIFTYGIGGTARTSQQTIVNSGYLSFTVGAEGTRQITISNTLSENYSCSLLALIGDYSKIAIV